MEVLVLCIIMYDISVRTTEIRKYNFKYQFKKVPNGGPHISMFNIATNLEWYDELFHPFSLRLTMS